MGNVRDFFFGRVTPVIEVESPSPALAPLRLVATTRSGDPGTRCVVMLHFNREVTSEELMDIHTHNQAP